MKKFTLVFAATVMAVPVMATAADTASTQDKANGSERGTVDTFDGDGEPEIGPANHNTTRSNKTTPQVAAPDAEGDWVRTRRNGAATGDANGSGAKATDYNSSRSNKSYATPVDLDSGDGGDETASTADKPETRHNWISSPSRSRPATRGAPDGGNEGDSDRPDPNRASVSQSENVFRQEFGRVQTPDRVVSGGGSGDGAADEKDMEHGPSPEG